MLYQYENARGKLREPVKRCKAFQTFPISFIERHFISLFGTKIKLVGPQRGTFTSVLSDK